MPFSESPLPPDDDNVTRGFWLGVLILAVVIAALVAYRWRG